MLRVQPSAPMAARVELATIKPSMLAHGFGMEESNDITLEDIIDAQGAGPLVLTVAVNHVLTLRPRSPLKALASKLRTYARKAPSTKQPEPEEGAAFDDTVSTYILQHRVVMSLQEAMNDALNALSTKMDEDGIDDVSHDFVLTHMASYLEEEARQRAAGSKLGPNYVDNDNAPEGQAGWYALPLRNARDDIDDEDLASAIRRRDNGAVDLAEWLMEVWTATSANTSSIEWVNCHEHALVNTFVKMSEVLNKHSVEQIGSQKLNYYKKVIEGSRAAVPNIVEEDSSAERLKEVATTIAADAQIVSIASGPELKRKDNQPLLLCDDGAMEKNLKPFSTGPAIEKMVKDLTDNSSMSVRAVISRSTLYGFVSFELNTEENNETTDYLHQIHVDEGVREKGLGSALYAVVESASRLEGAQVLSRPASSSYPPSASSASSAALPSLSFPLRPGSAPPCGVGDRGRGAAAARQSRRRASPLIPPHLAMTCAILDISSKLARLSLIAIMLDSL